MSHFLYSLNGSVLHAVGGDGDWEDAGDAEDDEQGEVICLLELTGGSESMRRPPSRLIDMGYDRR